jgi:very-short-patch-repair endonuclease
VNKDQEDRIAIVLRIAGYKFEREFKFHPVRKWRFDFALPNQKVAVEFEGGIFLPKARHTSMMGYAGDVEKYREAVLLGWKVLRYTAKDLAVKNGEYKVVEDLRKLFSTNN